LIEQAGELAGKSLPSRDDSPEVRWLKYVIYGGIAVVFLMGLVGLAIFTVSLEGPEKTLVPELRQLELADALLQLQDKELYGRIQLKFSAEPGQKGKVIDQRPAPGTVVKAGKRISLVVSKGSIMDKIENFVGRRLDEVSAQIRSAFSGQNPLLRIREPVMYVFNAAPAGTILQQKPKPGSDLSQPSLLELVVSRGPEPEKLKLPKVIGLDPFEAVNQLAKFNAAFVFQPAEAAKGQQPGRISAQNPAENSEVFPGSRIELKFSFPLKAPEGRYFGLFEYSLPDYAIPVDLRVDVFAPNGERSQLFAMKHPGGQISFPYALAENSTILLYVFNREIIRHRVMKPAS
jgi:eukaryotic-like serine/threonine-protein kinase